MKFSQLNKFIFLSIINMMQEKECRPSLPPPPKCSDATCLLGVGNELLKNQEDNLYLSCE